MTTKDRGRAAVTSATTTHGTLVVAYVRRSSQGTTKQETSLEDQRRAITEYCDARGWVIADWYVESRSGLKQQRPEFQRLLADAVDPRRQWSGVV